MNKYVKILQWDEYDNGCNRKRIINLTQSILGAFRCCSRTTSLFPKLRTWEIDYCIIALRLDNFITSSLVISRSACLFFDLSSCLRFISLFDIPLWNPSTWSNSPLLKCFDFYWRSLRTGAMEPDATITVNLKSLTDALCHWMDLRNQFRVMILAKVNQRLRKVERKK